ncbi:GNAT family N-acetyltransferase [Kocuria sp. CPCC 205268]|uniref:GNAT family N-acetyltransferase n=1 Tax=Kocuria oxytropis TaxID=3058913 RepID=UPI0034D4BD60
MAETSTITVRNNPDRHRYELLDGETVIGRAHWTPFEGPDGPQRIFYHTTVDDAYGGQGLATRLAREALDDTIAAGLPVVPVCPYIKKWLGRHPDHQQHAVPVRPEHLAAVPRGQGQ